MEEGCSAALTTHILRIDAPLNEVLHSFWDLESLGVVNTKEDSVLEEFTRSVQLKNGRYDSHPRLPDNGLLKRLRHDPKVLKNTIQSSRVKEAKES